ncbi:hypothetical protein [Clostridium manihotivorum]|uniref:hypothetical protein n=1 Tax=Clostridium manihotivorum TaxID=2320868 RepID=UPI0013E2DCD6|nr:hypothetical protein [Clostridium manihotivorum]
MIWIIYRRKNQLDGPRAIPFENDSEDIALEWINQNENRCEILHVAFSEDE